MKLPQLTLRELFLLVALAAMGCGWWVDRNRIQSRHRAEKIKINGDWETQHYRLIREHEERESLLATERNEAHYLLELERRKSKRSKDWPMPENPYQPPKELGTANPRSP